MGFGVGITTLKLSNKPSSKARKSRTGKLRSVACECLEERYGRDPDIDRSLTPTNTYSGEYRSGVDLTEQLTQEANEYSARRKASGGRALRSEAAIAYSVIVKPDLAAVVNMTPQQRDQFFRDSQEILDEIFQSRCRARVRHRDEKDDLTGQISEHEHSIYDGFTPDGRLCVDDLVNPRIWKRINTEYPAKMREKGWAVDDCDLYDEARAEKDPAYKAEREARRKDRGLTSAEFKRKARKAAQDARQADIEAERAALDEYAAERETWYHAEYQALINKERQIHGQLTDQDKALLEHMKATRTPNGRTLYENMLSGMKQPKAQQPIRIQDPPPVPPKVQEITAAARTRKQLREQPKPIEQPAAAPATRQPSSNNALQQLQIRAAMEKAGNVKSDEKSDDYQLN